ncbi:MAG TPA: hypothetical protein VNC81_02695 [Xanthobacteraceae bacterium]|nr:hypothetical protein [Xanthobacteraceae bacterium]
MQLGSDAAVIVQGTRVFGRRMTFHRRCGLAAMLVLCSTALAAAGDAQFRASDDFVLTGAQEDLIWQRMGREIPNDDDGAPCGCKPTLFSAVPSPVALHVLPTAVTAQIPMLKPYRYTKLGKRLLIVNPDDRRIVDVISPWKIVDVVRP